MNATATSNTDAANNDDQPASSVSAERTDVPRERQQPSLTPTDTETKDNEDESSSATESIDVVGQTVWIAAGHSYIQGIPDQAFSHVMGVYSTKAKAISRLQQNVRECPPTDPDQEEEIDPDDPRSQELVQAFLDDPTNWKLVVDPDYIDKGMGYQYTIGGLEEAVWIEERKVN